MALNDFDIPAIQQEISRAGPESVLYGVWNAILTWQFPVEQDYVTRPPEPSYHPSGAEGVFKFAYVPVSVCTTASQQIFDCAMQENWSGNASLDPYGRLSMPPTHDSLSHFTKLVSELNLN
ncbi:hypothetical protein VN97_g4876 [Penicillium thymicola]|uniref:Uncharacterized protein n=1 Tax=Penicillium thymicola TaxID=293382 RepID=A0AAI9TJQ0_PENTH|nr:hypothetical protein VN97_g4876 [Penicillium thymicola]